MRKEIAIACCMLCTSNDEQALVEHLPENFWDSRQGAFEEVTPWRKAVTTWQYGFRELAITARRALLIS